MFVQPNLNFTQPRRSPFLKLSTFEMSQNQLATVSSIQGQSTSFTESGPPSFLGLNHRPHFLRLDSTGDPIPDPPLTQPLVSLPFSIPKVTAMLGVKHPVNREFGLGHRYTKRTARYPRKFIPRQVNHQQGYPFHQFAMAADPSEKSVKFFGYHGETQVLNFALLDPDNFNPHNNPIPLNKSPIKKIRKMDCKNMNQQDNLQQNFLCDALARMSVHQTICMNDPILSFPSMCPDQTSVVDSGYDEPSLSSVGSEMKEDLKPHKITHRPEYVEPIDDCIKDSVTWNIEPVEGTPSDAVSFHSTVIKLDYESDTDSELEFSDTLSMFDSDTDSEIEDGDTCSRSAEFEILSCFIPDDPFNPMNFNGTCRNGLGTICNKKRPSQVVDDIEKTRPRKRVKRVRFVSESHLAEVHEEESNLADDYQEARCGPWEDFARGRERFKRRVAEAETILSSCFTRERRAKVWNRNQRCQLQNRLM